MLPIQLGERQIFEFVSGSGAQIPVQDFVYLPVPPMAEVVASKEYTMKELLLTLLEDRSLVVSSLETGQKYMWYEMLPEHVSEDDSVVDLKTSGNSNEPFFVMLTRKGRVLVFHYTLVDNKLA